MKKIAVIMGSASDLPVVRKAADTLKAFGVPHEVHVYSAHRTPDQAAAFARSARENGFAAIIAAAGMAAHLAGALEDASLAEKLAAHRAAGAEKALKASAEAEAEFHC